MILGDFKQMLCIDGITIKEEHCCCAKSASHVKSALAAINELKFGGEAGKRYFDCFNSVQGGHYEQRMRKYPYVYIFMGEGEVARFYALYHVLDIITIGEARKRNLMPIDYKEKIEGETWNENPDSTYFVLKRIQTNGNLEGRLLVRFSSGQQHAPTFVTASKYEVTQIDPIRSATEFLDYKSVLLTYDELKLVVKDRIWQEMLSRFGGVYLINDRNTGHNYVGSAYGANGFLGRWSMYAEDPTGGKNETGNVELVKLLKTDPLYAKKYFRYSILEVLPFTKSGINQSIIDAETQWKLRLGTRTHGYNAN